ncbi:MAG TPA: VanZ family protein [Patescibacteria group bacterium]|nr:VanZ family protein [Patescibacteria group bacterium]
MSATNLPSAAPAEIAPLREWIPVILWGALIFTLSTSTFSAVNTSKIIDPILRLLIPGVTAPAVDVGHMLVRKAAHFTEYGILFWLLVRGPMAERPYLALMLCVVYALTDEGHQVFVPGRTASLYDVALDSSGALFSHFLSVAITEIV